MQEYVVKENSILFDFLRENLTVSKNNIKSLLSRKNILVNNKIETRFDFQLKPGDVVSVGSTVIEYNKGLIKIIYDDKDFIVVDKPIGLLTVSKDDYLDDRNNLFSIVLNFLKKRNSNSKLYVVHRLDKDTSGVILFAKKEILMTKLQETWNEKTKRLYFAVVNGTPKKSDVLISNLMEKNLKTVSANEGKEAITEYKVIKSNKDFSLLDINIKTGRRNQIRVQLSDIGHPIVGDSKYAMGQKKYKRMYLHAYRLEIINPITNKKMIFESKVSSDFSPLVWYIKDNKKGINNMNCKNCGNALKENSAFCASCGTKVEVQNTAPKPEPKKETPSNCHNCGGPLKKDSVFCPSCGTKTSIDNNQEFYPMPNYNAPNKKGSGLKIAVIVLIILILLGVGGYFGYTYFFKDKDENTAKEKEKDKDDKVDKDKEEEKDNDKEEPEDEKIEFSNEYISSGKYKIYIPKDFTVLAEDKDTIKSSEYVINFRDDTTSRIMDVYLKKDEFIKSFESSGLYKVKEMEIKTLNDVEFIYIISELEDSEMMILMFDLDPNTTTIVTIMDYLTFKQPHSSVVYKVTEMVKNKK